MPLSVSKRSGAIVLPYAAKVNQDLLRYHLE